MSDMSRFHAEHRELLILARSVAPAEPVTPAAAERSRRQLAALSTRLTEHLAAEAATIDQCCRIGGADGVACGIRQREADGLKESILGLMRRWGRAGAIEQDARAFISTWEVVVSAMGRLHAREEGEIYPYTDASHRSPLTAPTPTGLPGIDRDHERLFATIGGLRAALGGGRQRVDAAVIADLATYAERHFADEEAIMEATGFPGLEDHRMEHHLARTILLGFRNDHLEGRPVEAASVLEFLEKWLASHIALVDHAMAEHALAAGWKV